MDAGEDELEFVNREAELAFLQRCFEQPGPALVVLRSPSGFGKSRLTSRLRVVLDAPARPFCVVDPNVRTAAGGQRLYDGYFIQRCAEALSVMAEQEGAPWLTFVQFLKTKRWVRAKQKSLLDLISELPSAKHLYKIGFDYASRLFGLGDHGASTLLRSDRADAVKICTAYVDHVVADRRITFIIREAQHIDLDSLASLLADPVGSPPPDIIFEYTSENGQFLPEHHKAFLRTARNRGGIAILDIVRLNLEHLELLLRAHVDRTATLATEAYLSWDGNLRAVLELKFQVGVGIPLAGSGGIAGVLANLESNLERHLASLSALERMLVAAVVAHIEPIDQPTLFRVVNRPDRVLTPAAFESALGRLISAHGFLDRSSAGVRVQNESIAAAATTAPGFEALIAGAEAALLEHYRSALQAADYSFGSMPLAVRQIFRLAAQTHDATALLHAVHTLSDEVRNAQDQTIYADTVASAIAETPAFYGSQHDDLVVWAASLAYGVGDWRKAAILLQAKQTQDAFSLTMRAFALTECGAHDEALNLAQTIRAQARRADEKLVAELIEILVIGCRSRGMENDARERLEAILRRPEHQDSPLIGYAYRFFEITDGFVDALPRLQESIAWFERFGFARSRAYSQLPAAMYLARDGQIALARTWLAEAQAVLIDEVRDQHLILNNRAAVELLADDGDPAACVELLSAALCTARDDFSELTIVTNLMLAHWRSGTMETALSLAERALTILEDHDFADQDTYWPVCFNVAQVLQAAGLDDRRAEVLAFPARTAGTPSVNTAYWQVRYEGAGSAPEGYAFLLSKPLHPLYLSHWVVDLEGLNLLRPAPGRLPARSSIPSP